MVAPSRVIEAAPIGSAFVGPRSVSTERADSVTSPVASMTVPLVSTMPPPARLTSSAVTWMPCSVIVPEATTS